MGRLARPARGPRPDGPGPARPGAGDPRRAASDGRRRSRLADRGAGRAGGAAHRAAGRAARPALRPGLRGRTGARAGPRLRRRVRAGAGRAHVPPEAPAGPHPPRRRAPAAERAGRPPRPAGARRSRGRERLLLRLAVGAAARRLHLSYSRLELGESRPRVPSFYALDLERARTGRVPDFAITERVAYERVESRLAWPAPKDPAEAIDDVEHDLAVLGPLLRQRNTPELRGRARYLLALEPALRRSLLNRWARWTTRAWSRYDGLYRPEAGARGRPRRASADGAALLGDRAPALRGVSVPVPAGGRPSPAAARGDRAAGTARPPDAGADVPRGAGRGGARARGPRAVAGDPGRARRGLGPPRRDPRRPRGPLPRRSGPPPSSGSGPTRSRSCASTSRAGSSRWRTRTASGCRFGPSSGSASPPAPGATPGARPSRCGSTAAGSFTASSTSSRPGPGRRRPASCG